MQGSHTCVSAIATRLRRADVAFIIMRFDVLALAFGAVHALDSCAWSCRYHAAMRVPSVLVPLDLAKCTVALHHCGARNTTAARPSAPVPGLYVAMTTIPPRAGKHLQEAVESLFKMRRQPDRVIVSASAVYKRFPTAGKIKFSNLAPRSQLETLTACEDNGPGTKLLCALPRLRELARGQPSGGGDGSGGASGGGGSVGEDGSRGGGGDGRPGTQLLEGSNGFAVLLDDDLRYKPWALEWLERAIQDDPGRTRHAYSYDVYTITPEGRAVTGGLYPGLLVGAGHAMFAIRVSLLDGVEDFFACVRKLEPRST